MENQSVFSVLSKINVNEKTEKKNGLTYLSWAWAWGITKQNYPSATYKVIQYDNKPYLFDIDLGYIVTTEVTIDGEPIPMNLPVMDGANKAQKNVPYTYQTKYGEKRVEQATMFDINTAIMRCLTKNLAMFGLGHYIYAGEDLPESVETKIDPPKKEPLTINKMIGESNLIDKINNCKTEQELKDLYNDNKDLVTKEMNPLFTAKKIELLNV